ncbi:MAG: peptide chain release factor N(5)-glutamine methyltransferase [Sphingomonadaceae bacterium]
MPPEGRDRRALIRAAAATLPGDTPRLDAELLLAHALGEERLAMLAGTAPVSADVVACFEALLERRRRREPVAHILGSREFWSLMLHVTPDVLVPRPDSETLIEAAIAERGARPPASILDLGTGSGALLLAALSHWPEARGLGIDRSAAALALAEGNAVRLGLAGRAAFQRLDWQVPGWVERLGGPFDLVLANPPYVPDDAELMPEVAAHEPPGALFAGADGLDDHRILIPAMPDLLAPGGVAVLEFGEGQAAALVAMAADAGLPARTLTDLAGRPRAIVLVKGDSSV